MEATTRQVLVVDDDDAIRETLATALEFEGYVVSSAPGGVEALQWLLGHASPDLILLDLMMPKMKGRELLEQLGSDVRLAAIPVVIISAFSPSDGGDIGAKPLLRKPLELDELLGVVAEQTRLSG
jgi:CheY-like chemotaxis protein